VYEPEPAPSKLPLFIGLGAATLAIGGTAFWLLKPDGKPTLPTAWANYAAADGSFTCETPEGWNVRGTGKNADGGAKMAQDNGVSMDSGGAHVEVSFSTVAALMTGQLLFGKETTPESMTGSRANGVYTFQKRGLKKRFNDFKEATMPPPESRMASVDPSSLNQVSGSLDKTSLEELFKPDIRISEFTGKRGGLGMGRPVQGIRACVGGRELIASVVCYCSPTDYASLKPAFLRIIGSIAETRKPGDGSLKLGAPGFGGTTIPGTLPRGSAGSGGSAAGSGE
jgi:hypothetical protein